MKNGFYERSLDTTIGRLENLKIPRDREGRFKTKLIEPYKKRDMNLEDLILGMFVSGMSSRSVSQALESIFELKYLPSTISQIFRGRPQFCVSTLFPKIIIHNFT